ncbi:similar to Saccharomyces cerevisiae YBR230C OM14 Integral mitochondrial outer membrane protein [Maudiozyma barnettii]|mgnify:CR=1 FL=1|nr:similar to Saccharomyces cerevisiae YBR230C OM14 Integral mitochondrial outer membrane protein [Kazachstania barnettii]
MSAPTAAIPKKQEEPVVVDRSSSCNEKNPCKKCGECLKNFKNKCCCSTSACFQKLVGCGTNVLNALKNPVVAINVLIGAASITSVLLGYIKYEKRFLADKPDIFVVGSVVGIAGLLTADCFLSRKYYKKFDKSE